MAVLTKDRIAPVLAVMGAVIGLVLVFSQQESEADDDDDAPAAPPSTSQVVPAPGASVPPLVPGQQAPAPVPAQPQDDGDGDDDG